MPPGLSPAGVRSRVCFGPVRSSEHPRPSIRLRGPADRRFNRASRNRGGRARLGLRPRKLPEGGRYIGRPGGRRGFLPRPRAPPRLPASGPAIAGRQAGPRRTASPPAPRSVRVLPFSAGAAPSRLSLFPAPLPPWPASIAGSGADRPRSHAHFVKTVSATVLRAEIATPAPPRFWVSTTSTRSPGSTMPGRALAARRPQS